MFDALFGALSFGVSGCKAACKTKPGSHIVSSSSS